MRYLQPATFKEFTQNNFRNFIKRVLAHVEQHRPAVPHVPLTLIPFQQLGIIKQLAFLLEVKSLLLIQLKFVPLTVCL
jgi:hypothetical protein